MGVVIQPVQNPPTSGLIYWINELNAVSFKTVLVAALQTLAVIVVLTVWVIAALTSVRKQGASADLYENTLANLFIFLGALSGINGATYFAKRWTNTDFQAARSAAATPPVGPINTGDNTQVTVTPVAPVAPAGGVVPSPTPPVQPPVQPSGDTPDRPPAPPPQPPLVTDMKRAAIQHNYQPGD